MMKEKQYSSLRGVEVLKAYDIQGNCLYRGYIEHHHDYILLLLTDSGNDAWHEVCMHSLPSILS